MSSISRERWVWVQDVVKNWKCKEPELSAYIAENDSNYRLGLWESNYYFRISEQFPISFIHQDLEYRKSIEAFIKLRLAAMEKALDE